MALLNYTNQNARRSQRLTPTLQEAIELAVLDVFGPGYSANVYSGGQRDNHTHGVGTTRHNDGKAGDLHVLNNETGEKVTGDALAPLIQYWAAKGYGGIGTEMAGGGIHLDEHVTPPKGGGMFWDYRKQGGRLTPGQREAYKLGKSGQMPTLVERSRPESIPSREQGLSDDVLHTAALTLLGEAAGEGAEGMAAVAHVIKNRAASKRYPSDLVSVMKQRKQFSTWNEGEGGNSPDKRFKRSDPIYKLARATAADVFADRMKDPLNGGTSYYAPRGMKGGKEPYWWQQEAKNGSVRIGNQVFALGNGSKPTTALAAIEAISPSNKAVVSKLGYASTPPARPSTGRQTRKGKTNTKFTKLGGYNNYKKLERELAPGVTKVASAFGNSILDTGQNLLGGAQKAYEASKPIQKPRPRPNYTKTASLNPVALPRPTLTQDPRFDFAAIEQAQDPATKMALDLKVAVLNNPIPTAPTAPKPLSTRNFDRAEAGFNVPRTQQMGKATINPPAVQAVQPAQPAQPNFIKPIAPQRPAGLGQQQTPVQSVVNGVRGALAPIRNVRHDIAGQIDGLKLAAMQMAQQQAKRAMGNRPSHRVSLDRVGSRGDIVHTNGYIYRGSPGNFKQVGKVDRGEVKMWSNTREKPKGYRYQVYDSRLGKNVWKTK